MAQCVPTFLVCFFNHGADAHHRGARLGADFGQRSRGAAVCQEVIQDQDALAFAEVILGNNQGVVVPVSVGVCRCRPEVVANVGGFALLGKKNRAAECFRGKAGDSYAACFHGQNQTDPFVLIAFVELFSDLGEKCHVDAVVEEAIHLEDIAGEDFSVLANAVFQQFHWRLPPFPKLKKENGIQT